MAAVISCATQWAPTASSSSNTPRPIPTLLRSLFERLGFPVVARHRSKNVTLHSQGDINFVINAEPGSFGQKFAQAHGPSVCAMAFPRARRGRGLRARGVARRRAASQQRRADGAQHPGHRRHRRLAHLFRRSLRRPFDLRRRFQAGGAAAARARGLLQIDHLTHNVHRGNMDKWTGFYETLFNFREIRYFDIEGKKTGLVLARADQPLRQDPHPDQRIAGRQVADRGIPARVQAARASSTSRCRPTTSTAPSTCCAAAASRSRTRRKPITKASTRASPVTTRTSRSCASGRILIDGSGADQRRHAAADLHGQRDRAYLLRNHPAQGKPGFRRRQFQGIVRVHRTRPDPPGRHLNLELYSFWRSSASYRVRIALNLKALPYALHARQPGAAMAASSSAPPIAR